MIKNVFLTLLYILIIFYIKVNGQGEVAIPFLLLSPSPNGNSIAGAYTALPTDDAFGFYYNPAQLGYFAKNNNFALHFYPLKTDYLPAFNFDDLSFYSTALIFGYDLKKKYPYLPLSIGLGYIYTKLNLGENLWMDRQGNILGTFDSEEHYSAYALGIGIDYIIKIYSGFSYKSIVSNLKPDWVIPELESYGSAKVNALDYGIMVNIPFIDIYNHFFSDSLTFHNIEPFVNLSFGYAIQNIGDKVRYSPTAQADPLPRRVIAGYGLSLGIDKTYGGYKVNVLKLDWSCEANDILVEREKDGYSWKYIDAAGSIDFRDNVIQGKSDREVQVCYGWKIKLFNTLEYGEGRFKGPGYPTFQNTQGFSISTRGILRYIASISQDKNIQFIADHFDLKYSRSEYIADSPLDANVFNGLQLTIYGF